MRSFPRVIAAAGAAIVLLASLARPAQAADKQKVVGGGSTFSQLLIDQWRADTRSKPYSLDFNYQGTGSSQGRLNFVQGTIDFAGSDIPYQPFEQNPPAGSFRYVTLVAGALGLMYNLQDQAGNQITNLRLDPTQLCRIFTAETAEKKAMFWDDPALRALNPGVDLPHSPILPVIRGDGSGTSYVLSEYCIATAPNTWKAFRDAVAQTAQNSQEMTQGLPVSNWPQTAAGVSAANGSTGVANQVASNPNTITYIEAGYSEITGLPLASVKNAAGQYVAPTPHGITVALSYATIRDNGTFQLDFDTPDAEAYFPSTYSYLIVPSNIDPGKGRTLSEYIYYAMTRGQDQAEPLQYARLSQNLVDDAIKTAGLLPGATPFADWKTAVGLTPQEEQSGSTDPAAGGGGGGATGGGGAGGGGATGGDGGGGATGGDGGGSTNDGGATGGGGGATGGATGGGGGGGGGGGATGGGATGGGGGDGGGSSAGGGATAGGTTAPGAGGASVTTVAGSKTTTAGQKSGTATNGAKSGGTGAVARTGTNSDSGLGGTGGGGNVVAANTAVRAPGPSNSDVVWTMLQGAAIVGVGLLLRRPLSGALR